MSWLVHGVLLSKAIGEGVVETVDGVVSVVVVADADGVSSMVEGGEDEGDASDDDVGGDVDESDGRSLAEDRLLEFELNNVGEVVRNCLAQVLALGERGNATTGGGGGGASLVLSSSPGSLSLRRMTGYC